MTPTPPPLSQRDPRAAYAAFLRGDTGARRSSSPVIAAGGGRIELCLSLPPYAASKNYRSWQGKAAATRRLREEACQAALVARVQGDIFEPWWGAEVRLRFFTATRRKRDPSNLLDATKGFIDGITDSGLWKDDGHVLTAVVDDVGYDAERPRTEVELLERVNV
jgi:Holliday junction resolvase RusA-like endonuclease